MDIDYKKELAQWKELTEENRQRTKQLKQLQSSLERISTRLEAMKVADYVDSFQKPWKLIWINILIGAARGLGFAIGTTVILAVLIAVVRRIIEANIPFITDALIQMIHFIKVNG